MSRGRDGGGQAREDGMGEGSLARGWPSRVDRALQVVSRQSVWAGLVSDDRLGGGVVSRGNRCPREGSRYGALGLLLEGRLFS